MEYAKATANNIVHPSWAESIGTCGAPDNIHSKDIGNKISSLRIFLMIARPRLKHFRGNLSSCHGMIIQSRQRRKDAPFALRLWKKPVECLEVVLISKIQTKNKFQAATGIFSPYPSCSSLVATRNKSVNSISGRALPLSV
jgi:hypothetical protein